uniref:Putative secreted protein n=1 Tax=Anopheles marajoara TaxID=58244 RepID=A0A2M4CD28_9DIPT
MAASSSTTLSLTLSLSLSLTRSLRNRMLPEPVVLVWCVVDDVVGPFLFQRKQPIIVKRRQLHYGTRGFAYVSRQDVYD